MSRARFLDNRRPWSISEAKPELELAFTRTKWEEMEFEGDFGDLGFLFKTCYPIREFLAIQKVTPHTPAHTCFHFCPYICMHVYIVFMLELLRCCSGLMFVLSRGFISHDPTSLLLERCHLWMIGLGFCKRYLPPLAFAFEAAPLLGSSTVGWPFWG